MHTTQRSNVRRSEHADRDRGLILPLVLVLTVVLGAVVVAIVTYTTTTLHAGTVVESRVDRLAATDAGMQIALEKLRTGEAGCTTTPQTVYSGTINRQPVAVKCQRTTINGADIGKFAVVVTAEGVPAATSSFVAQGTNVSTRPRSLGGNVYLARPPATLDKPVQVTDGDIYYFSPGMGCTNPTYSNLTIKPTNERGYICTNDTWQTMFPQPPLPAKNATNRIATGKTNAKGCTVFQPGVYKKAPIIGAGTQNFFEPGTYSFEFDGEIQIKNAIVTGGTSGPTGAGSSKVARTPSTFASPWCATAIDAFNNLPASTDTGITWILSDKSRISVDPNGQVELFAPLATTSTQMMAPSIIALQSSTAQYNANTLGATGEPLINLQEGSSNGVVIHGGVWAPTTAINLGNIAQSANGQFMGGVVIASLNLQTAASAGNFNFRVPTTAATRRVVLTSTSGATITRVVALVRASTGSYAIESRRVQ